MSDTVFNADAALPRGFRFAAVKAGIKPSGKPDFAVAVADEPVSAAAMFTANRVQAAPITIGRKHLERSTGRVRVVAVNAGNANCATGEIGITACEQTCRAAAQAFGCEGHEVFPSSTGIIGVPLPWEKLAAALPAVEKDLAADAAAFSRFAHAMLTTDTRVKAAHAALQIDGAEVRIAGACKGAGMIHPRLEPSGALHTTPPTTGASGTPALHATMLVYLFTDARVGPTALDGYLRGAVEESFNRISIDGDTSTNDTVLLLASGASGAEIGAGNAAFRDALILVCTSLAKQIVADGEGATVLAEIAVRGAASDGEARAIAERVATSPLVKTALYGHDANWGRIAAAAGSAKHNGGFAALDPDKLSILIDGVAVLVDGMPSGDEPVLTNGHCAIEIDLALGDGVASYLTSDLSYDYVRINAEYRS